MSSSSFQCLPNTLYLALSQAQKSTNMQKIMRQNMAENLMFFLQTNELHDKCNTANANAEGSNLSHGIEGVIYCDPVIRAIPESSELKKVSVYYKMLVLELAREVLELWQMQHKLLLDASLLLLVLPWLS